LNQKEARGRPRSQKLEARLLKAATDLIAETGSFSAVSIEAICRRAGCSKASFYRRWADRDEFLAALIAGLRPPVRDDADDRPLREDLIGHIRDITGADLAVTRIVMAALFAAEREGSPLLARYVATEAAPRRAAMLRRIERAKARGEIDPATDAEMLQEMLTAPVLKLVTMPMAERQVRRDFLERLVDQALRGLIPANPAKNT
jgi:AcrR family transcriptional regulator